MFSHGSGCLCEICHPRPHPHPVPAPAPDHVAIMHVLRVIEALIVQSEKRIMAGINEVNAALDQLGTSLGTQLTAIQTEIQQLIDAGGGATGDQLQAIVDRIGQFKAGVDQTISQLALDDPAPPAPGVGTGSAASVP